MEVGQGITTSTAMIIAEELDLPLDKVEGHPGRRPAPSCCSTSSPAAPTPRSRPTPRSGSPPPSPGGALLDAAAAYFDQTGDRLQVTAGVITNTVTGETVTYGDLAEAAASLVDRELEVELKDEAEFTVVGTARDRDDALLAVTGRKDFAMDLAVKGALPTMVCRATDPQRHRRAGSATAARWRGCPVSRASPWSPPASPSAPAPSASASTRSAR